MKMTQFLSHPFKVFFPKPSTITQTKEPKTEVNIIVLKLR